MYIVTYTCTATPHACANLLNLITLLSSNDTKTVISIYLEQITVQLQLQYVIDTYRTTAVLLNVT